MKHLRTTREKELRHPGCDGEGHPVQSAAGLTQDRCLDGRPGDAVPLPASTGPGFPGGGLDAQGRAGIAGAVPRAGPGRRDADLFRPGVESLDEALAALKSAAERDLGDYFRFSVKSCKQSTTGAGNGAKVQIEVLIGLQKKDPLSVDVVVKRTPTGTPTAMRLEPAVPIGWPET